MPLNDRVFDMPDLEFLQARARRHNEAIRQAMEAIEGTYLGLCRDIDERTRTVIQEMRETPSYETRKERCELMGMIFCTCTRVQVPEGERVIHDPNCKVCNYLVKLP